MPRRLLSFTTRLLAIVLIAQSARAQDADEHIIGDRFTHRQQLAVRGITFDLNFTVDGTKNLQGGIDTEGETWRRVFDFNVTLDTKTLLGIEGGVGYFDFQNAQGPNASDELVGDIQGIDGLDGVPGAPHQNRTQISQLWYQQTVFNGMLRIKAGKVDANTEFDHSDIAGEFLHQSAGSSATLFTLPTYPDPATGVNIFFKPWSDLQLGFGIYDGSYANGQRTGSRGPAKFFNSGGDLFLIGEIDQSWKIGADMLAGRIAVGGWYSTNTFTRLDGAHASGTGGPYALIEQSITKDISVFLMYGYADPAILPYDHNIGGGISWTGPLPGRPNDIAGIGAQCIHFSNGAHATDEFETSYEAFYRIQISKWFSIKPDVQYIANPDGNGNGDAIALTVRFQVDF